MSMLELYPLSLVQIAHEVLKAVQRMSTAADVPAVAREGLDDPA